MNASSVLAYLKTSGKDLIRINQTSINEMVVDMDNRINQAHILTSYNKSDITQIQNKATNQALDISRIESRLTNHDKELTSKKTQLTAHENRLAVLDNYKSHKLVIDAKVENHSDTIDIQYDFKQHKTYRLLLSDVDFGGYSNTMVMLYSTTKGNSFESVFRASVNSIYGMILHHSDVASNRPSHNFNANIVMNNLNPYRGETSITSVRSYYCVTNDDILHSNAIYSSRLSSPINMIRITQPSLSTNHKFYYARIKVFEI